MALWRVPMRACWSDSRLLTPCSSCSSLLVLPPRSACSATSRMSSSAAAAAASDAVCVGVATEKAAPAAARRAGSQYDRTPGRHTTTVVREFRPRGGGAPAGACASWHAMPGELGRQQRRRGVCGVVLVALVRLSSRFSRRNSGVCDVRRDSRTPARADARSGSGAAWGAR
jgi:hypothetical protein